MEIRGAFKIFPLAIFLFAIFAAAESVAQHTAGARVSGLETDSVYMSLLEQEAALRHKRDSLYSLIASKREAFSRDSSGRAVKAAEIMSLEEELFDTKNKIGMITARSGMIEQDMLMRSMGAAQRPETGQPSIPSASVTDYANLTDNAYFKKTLTGEEYAHLKKNNTAQATTDRYAAQFAANVRVMDEIKRVYDTVSSQREADLLREKFRYIEEDNRMLEDSTKNLWEDIYGNKIYVYSYLLDKLGRTDVVKNLHEDGLNIENADKEVISPLFASYAGEARLLVSYELSLAEILDLEKSVDSLRARQKALLKADYNFGKLILAPRDFIKYSEIHFVTPSVYTSRNPIPAIEIPSYGVCYSVLLGSYSTKQPPSIFKGATPLYVELVKGQYRYFAGIIATLSDADAAAGDLRKAGFRRPEVVVWKNGVYENLAAALAEGEGFFRVRVECEGGVLNAMAKEAVEKYAKNRDITRDDEGAVSIGIFDNSLKAAELADALNGIRDVKAVVTMIGK